MWIEGLLGLPVPVGERARPVGVLHCPRWRRAMSGDLKREGARAYRERWKLVRERAREETRRMSLDEKFRRCALLMHALRLLRSRFCVSTTALSPRPWTRQK